MAPAKVLHPHPEPGPWGPGPARALARGAARGARARGEASERQSMSSIKRDVKKKVLPRPEGEKVLSRDPAHFTVRVPLDLRERFYKKGCQEKSSPSTGRREDFVSRSSPLHCKSASRFAREVLLLSCLSFL